MLYRLVRYLNLPRFEYVYVLWWRERPYSAKIGFSQDWKQRRSDIRREIEAHTGQGITLLCLLCLPVLFARPMEQLIHRNLRKVYKRDTGVPGSGSTEWYNYFNFVGCGLVLLILSALDWFVLDLTGQGWYCLALLPFVAPLPFDFAIIVTALCLMQWVSLGWILWHVSKFVIFVL
jgi:hypothetical protein